MYGRWLRRIRAEETGSQLLEFMLTFPLVWVLFVFSADQFSIFYNKQKALAAAYEAGRIACLQPNYGLARYHGRLRGLEELEQAIAARDKEVEILPEGRWKKGNHLLTQATVRFDLLASGQPYEVTESYYMMIENAGDTDGAGN